MTQRGLVAISLAGVRWIALGKLVLQLTSWAMTVFVVRLLVPADYGLAALAGLVTMLMGMLLDAGLGPALVQQGNITQEVYRSANGVLLIAAGASIGVVTVVAGPIATFFIQPQVAWILRVAAIQFVLSALSVAPNAQLTTRMAFRELAIIQAVGGLSQGLATLLLALVGAAFWSLIVGVLFGSLVKMLLLHLFVDLRFGLSFALSPLRRYWQHSKFLVGQRLAWYFADQADQFVVGRFLGASPLGIFSIAKNLANMPLDRVAEVVYQVALPAFSHVRDDPSRWSNGFRQLIRVSSAVAFPLFWGMAAVAPVGLPLALGNKWASATMPFVLLAIALPLRTVHVLSTTALYGRGRADVSFYTVLVWALMIVPALTLGVRWGASGVAAAWAIAFPLIYVVCIFLTCRALRSPIRMMLEPLAVPATCAAVSSLAAFCLALFLNAATASILLLVLQMVVGVALYVGAFRVLSKERYIELKDLLRRFATR